MSNDQLLIACKQSGSWKIITCENSIKQESTRSDMLLIARWLPLSTESCKEIDVNFANTQRLTCFLVKTRIDSIIIVKKKKIALFSF
jgi:hypothetical protein